MMVLRKNKIICLLSSLMLLTGLNAGAQISAFKFKANVQKIDSAGVYRIGLSPDLVAKSRKDMNDIRLTDNSGKNVAYVLSNKLQLSSPDTPIVFPEVKSGGTDTGVVYIVSNKNALNINSLGLTLKTTEVNRCVNLSGSDDLKEWFAIEEDIPLMKADRAEGPDYRQHLDFPNSNYRYFKIQIFGKDKTPVKILQAGIYAANLNVPVYEEIPPINFTKKDTNGKTSLFINLPQDYQLNKLHINVSSPKYFNRRIVVSVLRKYDADQIVDTVISSAGRCDLILSAKTKKLQVDIYNGDDNPLNITSIEAYQLKEFAVAYLESGHTYSLFTGNNEAKPVSYDLSFLNNRAYNQLPGIIHSEVHRNPAFTLPHQLQPTDHTVWLWASIIIVLLVLCFLTLKMVREIKRV